VKGKCLDEVYRSNVPFAGFIGSAFSFSPGATEACESILCPAVCERLGYHNFVGRFS
jgi:hypothetical protein